VERVRSSTTSSRKARSSRDRTEPISKVGCLTIYVIQHGVQVQLGSETVFILLEIICEEAKWESASIFYARLIHETHNNGVARV
jgi:hypothetical protein